ncbi:Transposon Tf2-12 polyprotein [Vitis vinifera]|uniref:Transposon Tf2-12 polyprotein n=1 Tax=Vitis vinifera TaxID=29760 RepID=A0A438D621_VITVI|nr:Transposon Tf2-12 polyprotein [Vitis vinifera]
MFGVSTIEVLDGPQTILISELLEDDSSLFEGTISLVEGAFDFMDPPLSFDVLSGFVSRFDDVSIASFMDLSIFEPVKQKLRQLHPRWSLQVKEEIQKQFSVGFISVVEYPEWLANIVPIPKNDGKVRVCVDFKDLNKLALRMTFPSHTLIYFDGSRRIWRRQPLLLSGVPTVIVMSFGLKNAGATYQRATTLFHDMMHRDVKVYVDDMIVKSQGRAYHLETLERFFERIRKFRLRLNPKKCTFGVTSGKLLGHMVSERGIEVDPDKVKAILDMLAPKTKKEIMGFLGRLQYINCFIARLIDICEPIFRFLRKNQPTVWNDDFQLAFENIKEYLLSPPVLVPLMLGHPLLLYLSILDMALGCMLAQIDDSGKEQAIYYLKFDIQYVSQKFIKGSVVADHLASLSTSEDRPVDDFPNEEFVAMTSLLGWCMYFDSATNQLGYGIGVLLVSPQGDHILRSICLEFLIDIPITNNIVEYEACILVLETALELGIGQMEVLVARFDDLRTGLLTPLATLASSMDIPIDVVVHPLLIELRSAPAYCCLIGETEV